MDKFKAMQVFTRVVDSNSFAAAADALHMTRSSVSTIVQDLEAYLKVRLLNRTTRRISLTPDGAAYYERCVRILAEVQDSEHSFATPIAPRGKLKVDLPSSLGRKVFVPALHDFQSRYPDIDLMLGIGDKAVDLVQDGVDCAIRMGPLRDSSLVAKRIGTTEFVTVASPDYLARHGTPTSLGELDTHIAVNYFSLDVCTTAIAWSVRTRLLPASARPNRFPLPPRLSSPLLASLASLASSASLALTSPH
jgi:LysR family transcriptional regulator for bpeEF and oprC